MASKNKTVTIALNQWDADDQPLRVDFNSDNIKIDNQFIVVNNKFSECNSSIQSAILAAERAQTMAWQSASGDTLFNLNPTARGYLAESILDPTYIDITKCGASYQYDVPTAKGGFIAAGGRQYNYLASSPYRGYNNDATIRNMTVIDLPYAATITSLENVFYGYYANQAISGTYNLYKLNASDVPTSLVASHAVTVPGIASGQYVACTTSPNWSVAAGCYGLVLENSKHSGGATYGVALCGNNDKTFSRAYIFKGLNVAPSAPTGNDREMIKINWTYSNPSTSLTVRTKQLNFGAPVTELGVYARHSGLTGLITAYAIRSDGSKMTLTRDAAFGAANSSVERFTGKLTAANTIAIEFVLSPSAPAGSKLLAWFVTAR